MEFKRKLRWISVLLLGISFLTSCGREVELSTSSAVGDLTIAGGQGPAAGVRDLSWGAKRETNVQVDGRKGLNVTYERARAGLSYGLEEAIPTRGGAYKGVAVTLKGSGQQLALYVEDAERTVTRVNLEASPRLQTVYIPWDELGSPSRVSRVTLQENGGSAQAAFFLDNLYLYRDEGRVPLKSVPEPSDTPLSDPIPAADSRLIYVSSSYGDDDTAETYLLASSAVGSDYLRPANVKAFASISEAYEQVREGHPDWIFLQKGEAWQLSSPIKLKSGRSPAEPSVIASFGGDLARPLLKTGAGSALSSVGPLENVVIAGIEAYADARDSASPTFKRTAMNENPSGFRLVSTKGEIDEVLFLDNKFRSFKTNIVQASERYPVTNISLKRNIILDNYATNSHSQGVFAGGVTGLAVEDNVFDHNGWRVQGVAPGTDSRGGQATMFNHNLYISNSSDVVLKGNFIARAASMGVKVRSDATAGSEQIDISDNLFIEGEIGIGIGGNTDAPARFSSVSLTDNVFHYVGRTRPTGRKLAWNIDVKGWADGEVTGNLIAKQPNSEVTNVSGIKLADSIGLKVIDNTFAELNISKPLVVADDVRGDIRLNTRGEGYRPLESYVRGDFSTFIIQMRKGDLRASDVIEHLTKR